MINYKVEGPGNIKVIDNGDPADKSPYNSSKKRVNRGSQLVIIQSTVEPGDLIISAIAEGLKPSQLKIRSVPANNN
jgi:beta-galactosidase